MLAKEGKFDRRGEKLIGYAAPSLTGEVDGGAVKDFFDITKQNGVTSPAGKPGVSIWDPAGLAKNIDANTFRQYRGAELKHGRVCMIALLGLIAQHSWRLPPFRFEPSSGIEAVSSGHASAGGLAMIIFIAGIFEYNTTDDNREPGDFGDPFDLIPLAGFDPGNSDELTLWRNRELNHCRLAMVGVLGCFLAEYATGFDAVDQWKFAGAAWDRTLSILSFPESPVGPLETFM